MNSQHSITRQEISSGLRGLGLPAGAKLLVHSSLRSLGHVQGGAEAVIDALLDALGPHGTLLAPTLTGHESLSAANPPVFDPVQQQCWTGVIPETLRRRPGALRSLHPTHSAAAIGHDADHLTRDHALSVTPCDELSPYGKLARLDDAYILLLGVDHESNTTFHYVEEVAGVGYHMQEGFVEATIVLDDRRISRHVMLHRYGAPRNFSVMEPLFVEQGIQRQAVVGNALLRLVHVGAMVRATLCALRADAHILCRPPDG